MNSNKDDYGGNIVNLDEIRSLKKTSTISLLKDSRKAAQAITSHTCLICNMIKMCVSKTGVCASCYENVLTPEEQKIADNEAQHKTIKIIVTDDRWQEQ